MRYLFLISLLFIIIYKSSIWGEEFETQVRSYKILSDNPSGFVDILEIKDNYASLVDISDVLTQVTGVQINKSGGVDSFSTVMIRGAPSNSVDVFINGVRINPLFLSSCNIASLPDEVFERIEIYKGFTPSRLGFSNTGGAINLVTGKGKKEYYGVKISYGSFNTMEGGLFASDSNGESGFFLHLYSRHTDGDYKFINHNGTPYNTEDDIIKSRQNNYKNEYALNFTATSRLHKIMRLNLSIIPYFSQGGIAGPENLETKYASFDSLTNIFSVESHWQLRQMINEIVFGYSNIYYRIETNDEKGELNMLFADIVDTSGIKNNVYLISSFAFFKNNLMLKLGYSDEEVLRKSRIGKMEDYIGEREEYFLIIEDNIEVVKKRLYLIPSFGLKGVYDNVAYSSVYLMEKDEKFEINDWVRNYRVGLLYKLTDELLFKTNYSLFNRYPDVYEIFGDGIYIFPNPKLKPEKGNLFDVGFEFGVDRLILRFVVFKNVYNDLINFWQNSQKTIKSENISKAEIYGTELYMQPIISRLIISEISYTHQEPINKSDIPSFKGKILPFRYTDNLTMRYGLALYGFRLIYGYNYSSQNYFDAANFLPIEGMPRRSIHNFDFSYYSKNLDVTVSLAIKNITDVWTEDIAGYPLPGRMFFVGLYKTFKPLRKEVNYEKD